MKNKLRVALLAGGRSGEREVSLKGAAVVAQSLDPQKYEVMQYDPATDLNRLIADSAKLDVAFILLHGRFGEDGTVQGLLDLLGIPYQGSGVLGSSLAMHKHMAKVQYKNAGLLVPDWLLARPEDAENPERILGQLSLPLVVKPVQQGSSLGMSIARTVEELRAGIALAFNYDQEVMVEQYIRGREITGGVLGNATLAALPLVEIIPGEQFVFFDYTAKYTPGASHEVCPAELDPALTARAQEIALKAHRALMLKGYSRSDMILAGNDIYLLETNTIPGMTPTSLLPQAAKAHGLSFAALLDRLLELALERPVSHVVKQP